jgi:hypothetical protein
VARGVHSPARRYRVPSGWDAGQSFLLNSLITQIL